MKTWTLLYRVMERNFSSFIVKTVHSNRVWSNKLDTENSKSLKNGFVWVLVVVYDYIINIPRVTTLGFLFEFQRQSYQLTDKHWTKLIFFMNYW